MVKEAASEGMLLSLESLSWKKEWSAFLQYLAHTYKQIGNHNQFALEVEQVLRGTLGFQELRQSDPVMANQFVEGVRQYGGGLAGQPLSLVDHTGFSLETVRNTLVRLSDQRVDEDAWTSTMFDTPRPNLSRMMGILLEVPELRNELGDVIGGSRRDGDKLARIVCDWVQGRSLSEMAMDYFKVTGKAGETDAVATMTKCCQRLFGRLTQTASWGLAALQTLTFRDRFDDLDDAEKRSLRNLPGKVYYGVNTDEALLLRLIGVPRRAAEPLSRTLEMSSETPLTEARAALREGGEGPWQQALGDLGPTYRMVWSIIEAEGASREGMES